jgi:hypothetical protein
MKQILSIALLFTALAISPVIAHAQNGEKPKSGAPAAAQKYTCPMHLEVISEKPGKCPKCGMNLVPLK